MSDQAPTTDPLKQINIRLPKSVVELMKAECRSRNMTQTEFLSQRITRRAGAHRRNDGLQIERLKALHRLKGLLETTCLDEIDRRNEAQRMFDHLYETFFSEVSESDRDDARDVGDGLD